jgi:hypothetical protein
LLIDYGEGAALPRGLTYQGTGARSNLVLTDTGQARAHRYTLVDSSVTRDRAPAIRFEDVQGVTINAGNGADTFRVSPSATTAFRLHGGGPTPATRHGDSLSVKLVGLSNAKLSDHFSLLSGYSGQWALANALPILFDGIETLTPKAS